MVQGENLTLSPFPFLSYGSLSGRIRFTEEKRGKTLLKTQFDIHNFRSVADAHWGTPGANTGGDIHLRILFLLVSPAYLINHIGDIIKGPELAVMGMA